MIYTVKEIYYTLQGEGIHTGRAAVFCRFSGCNLWSGIEKDRETSECRFCDTDFVGTDGPGGGSFLSAEELCSSIDAVWLPQIHDVRPFVVCTGGEPLLQVDEDLIDALHLKGFEVAIETNGTLPSPPGVDWICVSPKAGTELVVHSGNELKLVFPQPGAEPERFEGFDFEYFSLQPMDGPDRDANSRMSVQYCLKHPKWSLSLQTHKYLGIP